MNKVGCKAGFTLVELSLAIAFVAILSIAITVVTINIVNIYQRGLVLKQINSAGIDISDDLRLAIGGSSTARSLASFCGGNEKCIDDGAYEYVYDVQTATVNIRGEDVENVPVFGAFCSGDYSYIWNSGYFFGEEYDIKSEVEKAKFQSSQQTIDSDFSLLKIADPNRAVCAVNAYKDDNKTTNIYNIGSSYMPENPVILLDASSSDLAIYELYAAPPAEDLLAQDAFYSGSFILATITGGINVVASGDYCAPPGDYDSNFNYCAINKFNFAVRANGD